MLFPLDDQALVELATGVFVGLVLGLLLLNVRAILIAVMLIIAAVIVDIWITNGIEGLVAKARWIGGWIVAHRIFVSGLAAGKLFAGLIRIIVRPRRVVHPSRGRRSSEARRWR